MIPLSVFKFSKGISSSLDAALISIYRPEAPAILNGSQPCFILRLPPANCGFLNESSSSFPCFTITFSQGTSSSSATIIGIEVITF